MKVQINGQVVDTKPLGFSTIGESWSEYRLESGEIVRAKMVLTHIFDTGTMDSAGNKIYQFSGTPVFAVHD